MPAFVAWLDMKRIDAVTFDLWDTLIQEVPGGSSRVAKARIERIATTLETFGRPHTLEEIEGAYVETGGFLYRVWNESKDVSVRDQVIFMMDSIERKLPSRLGAEAIAEIEETYSVSMLDHRPVLLPGAKEALQDVHDMDMRMGLISNTGRTPGTVLRTIMKDLGILQCFSVTTFSNEILARKPAPAVFSASLEGLRAQVGSALHIGDDPGSDIDGATDFGMRAIQIRSDKFEDNERAGACVDSLDEVVDAIDSLRKL